MKTTRIEIVNVRLPGEIVEWLDDLVKRGFYKSRSEAVREFSRDYIKESRCGQNE